MRKFATARRHDAYRTASKQPWPCHAARDFAQMSPRDNQVVHGLIVGLPIALALWIALAMIVWTLF
jgi:hypothetical protein